MFAASLRSVDRPLLEASATARVINGQFMGAAGTVGADGCGIDRGTAFIGTHPRARPEGVAPRLHRSAPPLGLVSAKNLYRPAAVDLDNVVNEVNPAVLQRPEAALR